MTNTVKRLLIVPAALLALGTSVASADKTLEEAGSIVCVNDKWDETEPEKGHKLVNYAGRCVKVPDDSAAVKTTEACEGKYEYLPDGSWTGSGTCTATQKSGDTLNLTWEESSQLDAWPFKVTGGTGKFQGVVGGGTYKYDQLTDTLFAGRYNTKLEFQKSSSAR